MKPSELKYLTKDTERYFFTHETMKFFGDHMSNYGVRSSVVDSYSEANIPVWELYRKHPVKYGLCSSAYFRKDTFERVFPKKGG